MENFMNHYILSYKLVEEKTRETTMKREFELGITQDG